jgi:hypothetical protein
LPSIQVRHSAKHGLSSVSWTTLDKVASSSSANVWRSIKVMDISYRQLLRPFTERHRSPSFLTLGKAVVAECLILDKRVHCRDCYFTECPTKSTRQSAEYSAKSQIPVVILPRTKLVFVLALVFYIYVQRDYDKSRHIYKTHTKFTKRLKQILIWT